MSTLNLTRITRQFGVLKVLINDLFRCELLLANGIIYQYEDISDMDKTISTHHTIAVGHKIKQLEKTPPASVGDTSDPVIKLKSTAHKKLFWKTLFGIEWEINCALKVSNVDQFLFKFVVDIDSYFMKYVVRYVLQLTPTYAIVCLLSTVSISGTQIKIH